MNLNVFSRWMPFSSLAVLTILSCNFAASTVSPTLVPTGTQVIATQSESTATVSIVTQVGQGTITASPSCTVLQDLNLRFGPGTAYRPPIKALPANSVVTPLGFIPQGIPGGAWAYVREPAAQDLGWVSAGPQYISCNVELSALPPAAFGTPPPPPLPKSVLTSDPDGSGFCVDPDDDIECVGIFSDQSLFQFQIIRNGQELGTIDGVEPVSFVVFRILSHDPFDFVVVYDIIENQSAYCILGGNGPCNGWVIENGIYKWRPGGIPIEPGDYLVGVDITMNGNSSHWEAEFSVTLP